MKQLPLTTNNCRWSQSSQTQCKPLRGISQSLNAHAQLRHPVPTMSCSVCEHSPQFMQLRAHASLFSRCIVGLGGGMPSSRPDVCSPTRRRERGSTRRRRDYRRVSARCDVRPVLRSSGTAFAVAQAERYGRTAETGWKVRRQRGQGAEYPPPVILHPYAQRRLALGLADRFDDVCTVSDIITCWVWPRNV